MSHATIEELLAQRDWLVDLVRRLVTDPGTADDIVQDTCLTALRRPPGHGRGIRGWLATVARNLATDRRRRRAREDRRDRRAPAGTVRSRLSRGHRMLRERLDRRHEGDRRAWVLMVLPLLDSKPAGGCALPGCGASGDRGAGGPRGRARAGRGSFDPVGPTAKAGGRVVSTALAVLCLEVYYRYHTLRRFR